MSAAFDPSAFWPVFKEAGTLVEATITSGGDTFPIDVDFSMPDRERFGGGAMSRDYEMEYQHADAPDLAKGDAVVIGGVSYRVREPTMIPDRGNASDGTFRIAVLTKV